MVDLDVPADISAMNFEEALAELEQIVRRLEGGQVKLDEAILFYERRPYRHRWRWHDQRGAGEI